MKKNKVWYREIKAGGKDRDIWGKGTELFLFFNIYLFICLHQILVEACESLVGALGT